LVVQITPDGYIALSGIPQVGHKYQLEDLTEGTGEQNRAFHALCQEYWASGLHSYPAKTFAQFRDYIKRDLGAGFESFVVATPDGIKKAADRTEVSEILTRYGITDTNTYALGKLKSWADYTKKERIATIDHLIAEMIQAGVNSAKFQEILRGME
jgi:hypothetical protein